MILDAENVYQVYDWLWTSGQLSASDIVCLPEYQISTVINLALPTSSNALFGESELITRQGINYVHIPVSWERPELYQLEQFFCMLQAFECRNIWVHCAKNKRVSVFVYLYRRICLTESDEIALYPMREIWVPNSTWQAFIHRRLSA